MPAHALHEVRALQALHVAGPVVDLGGGHQLAALFHPGDQQRRAIGARRVDRGAVAGGAGAQDDQAAVDGLASCIISRADWSVSAYCAGRRRNLQRVITWQSSRDHCRLEPDILRCPVGPALLRRCVKAMRESVAIAAGGRSRWCCSSRWSAIRRQIRAGPTPATASRCDNRIGPLRRAGSPTCCCSCSAGLPTCCR